MTPSAPSSRLKPRLHLPRRPGPLPRLSEREIQAKSSQMKVKEDPPNPATLVKPKDILTPPPNRPESALAALFPRPVPATSFPGSAFLHG
jgi:hypothetical protein